MEDFQIGLDQDFNACEGFVFVCKSCEKDTIVREPIVGKVARTHSLQITLTLFQGLDARLLLEECSQCKCDLLKQSGQLTACLVNALREQIRRYLQVSYKLSWYMKHFCCSEFLRVRRGNMPLQDGRAWHGLV